MTQIVGELIEINRYPVKSFAGESLAVCHIEKYGLFGDRFFAFHDETKEGWASFVTAREIPSMLAYKAKLIERGGSVAGSGGNVTGNEVSEADDEVSVTSPDGRIFTWNEDLLSEIQRFSKRKLSMMSCHVQNTDIPDHMAVDEASILIITDTALRTLEALWGKQLDARRFRANLVVSLSDHALDEGNWIGKRLTIGSASLQIDTYCERCSMITIDPDTLQHDASLLKLVNERMDLNFGVYASVKQTGQIQVGDKVYLVN